MIYVAFALLGVFAGYYVWKSDKLIRKALDTLERYKDLCDMQEELIRLLEDINQRNIDTMHDVIRDNVRVH